MSKSPINQLRERVLGDKKDQEREITIMLDMGREFGCIGEIIGRDFEIRDPKGNLIYLIHQRPMAIKQMNTLLKEFAVLKKQDNDREAAKWGTKGKGKFRR